MAEGAVVNMAARDPWKDLDPKTILEVLTKKGWKGLGGNTGEVTLQLGTGIVALVKSGQAGEKNLDRLIGAHGDFHSTPSFVQLPRQSGRRVVYLFRAPPGEVHTAENLHGAVAGVHLLARGQMRLPPSIDNQVMLRWERETHPSFCDLAPLPQWLADIMRDPGAAHRAWNTVSPTRDEKRELAAWEEGLTRARGKAVRTFGNVMKIFRGAPGFAGRFRHNVMTQGIEFEGKNLPEGRIGWFREQIEDADWGGFDPSEAAVMQAIRALAEDRTYHPVQDYLRTLQWDGTGRLDAVASEILAVRQHTEEGATDDEKAAAEAEFRLSQHMVRRWFISAIARAMDPGCQVDTSLVLIGDQGLRKSSFFRAMAGGSWFADTEVRIGDKDGMQQIHAAWITEWGEIDRITSARHAGEVKAFIARRTDTFRPPYGRITEAFKRSCVIVGSTNNEQFLTDPTGSRRFWCIRVGGRIDLELAAQWRDQLWAEALHAYRAGERWWLDEGEDRARELAAERHRLRDPWEAVIERYIDGKWREDVKTDPTRRFITTALLLERAVDLPAKDRTRAHEMRVGEVMKSLGFRGEQKAVPKSEAGLFTKPDGTPARKFNHWVREDTADETTEHAPPVDDDYPSEVDF